MSMPLFFLLVTICVCTHNSCVSICSPEVSCIFDTTLFLFIPICTMFRLLPFFIHLCSLSLPFARFFYISAQSRCPFLLFLYTHTYSKLSFVKLRRSRGPVLSCKVKHDRFVVGIFLCNCGLAARQYFVIYRKN